MSNLNTRLRALEMPSPASDRCRARPRKVPLSQLSRQRRLWPAGDGETKLFFLFEMAADGRNQDVGVLWKSKLRNGWGAAGGVGGDRE